MSPPVVFAVTVAGAGRKLVDYYLTWRGQKVSQSYHSNTVVLVLIAFQTCRELESCKANPQLASISSSTPLMYSDRIETQN